MNEYVIWLFLVNNTYEKIPQLFKRDFWFQTQ